MMVVTERDTFYASTSSSFFLFHTPLRIITATAYKNVQATVIIIIKAELPLRLFILP